jgi:hypothetical protein
VRRLESSRPREAAAAEPIGGALVIVLRFRDKDGNYPTGGPNAHAAYPLRRSGTLDTRMRSIRPPAGSAWYQNEFGARPPFRARLAGHRGRVTMIDTWWASSACSERQSRRGFDSPTHYVDVARAFGGHEPCGPKSEWLHSLVLRGDVAFSFHPNRAGQAAYARRLTAYVLCLEGHRWPFQPSGMPDNPRGRRVPGACEE